MVMPWKYGFKSIKVDRESSLRREQPPTAWNIANAHEYGFYSNVNPHGGPSRAGARPRSAAWTDLSSASDQDADVQWLRIKSPACTRAWICASITEDLSGRNPSAMDLSRHINMRWIKPPVFLLCLGAARRIWSGRVSSDESRRESRRIHHALDRDLDAGGSVRHAGRHAAAQAAAPELADSLPAHVRPLRVLLRLAAFHHLHLARLRSSTSTR